MKTGKRSTSIKKNHIPRPKNSFMIYRQEKQYEAAKHIEGNNNKDISKLVGKWWNNEAEEVKSYYRRKAEEAKKIHSKLYPNYRYCPKKSAKNNNQQQPVLPSNVTRHHYKDYCQFLYTHLNHPYINNEILANIPPCTCCDTLYPTQDYGLPTLPIQESLETHQYFNGLDLTNTPISTTTPTILPPPLIQYETPPQAFLPEYNFNYLTPITQSPASVTSGTFTQTSDSQLNLGYWNNDPNIPFNEIIPMYNLLPNQYELSVPETSGFVNPNVIYHLDPSTTNRLNY